MVAVNEASGRVYVTDGLKETVWVFGPPVAPVVGRELTAEIGASEVKLGALVEPRRHPDDLPLRIRSYQRLRQLDALPGRKRR